MVDFAENPFLAVALAQAKATNNAAEAQKISAALRKVQDNSPGAQAATNVLPQATLNQLTSNFDVTRIPLSRLRQMMRDPMIAFAFFFIRAQILRARWAIQCSDAQVAAFVDQALREIYPSLVSQYLMKLNFGYQALVKRFETKPGLDWTYIDPADALNPEKPVWDQQAIDPLVWKKFAALPPESVEPLWTPQGDFNGIKYKPVATTGTAAKETEFDVLHCSPGDERVLTTNRGYVAMAELDPSTDRLVVWDKKQKRFCRTKGFEFQMTSRPYVGDLLTVAAGASEARVTPNHKFTVRWTEEAQNKYSVYLMKKGDWWRMGITRVAREGSKSSGLGIRLSAEGAEAAWVLGTFDSKNEALYHEKLWSNQYQIPDMIFRTSKWEYGSQTEHCLTTEQIEQLWSQLDSASGAQRLLADRQLDAAYPFLLAKDPNPRGTRGWTCHAVNMIDGLMEVPVDLGDEKAGWETISVTHANFEGDVFSIDVPPHHHYVSNGVVTQNSLWVTNESESVFDSLWGYPRIGYAYRFWWSFWFNWGLADRHFEKDADPPAIVYYPSNKPDLIGPDGQTISRRQVALNIGDRARSNSTIALPSDLQLADDGTTKNIREWEIDFAKGGGNFDAFQQRFDQLQVLILRACMVPEQAFLEGKGGTSSRNVAGELQDAFAASQIVLMQELDYDINRYIIPQLVAANFPEKVALGIKAKKVTKGFDTEDLALAKIIIQGVANKDASQLELDLPAMIDAVGLPRLSPADIAKKNAELQAQAQQTVPDPQAAVAGAGGQAGVTQEGLYYNPREVITLSSVDEDASATFMAELTAVGALRDPVILSDAQRIRNTWQSSLMFDFSVARNLLNDYGSNLNMDEDFFERFFRRIKGRAHDTAAQTRRALGGIMRRASTTEFEKVGLKDFSWDPFYSERASAYLSERTKIMTEKITVTTRDQVKTYLAELVKKGTPPAEMPGLLQAHFKMFSGWRADQIVRTEVAMAYNMATLLAAEDAGIKQVQALDAQLGPERSDAYCIARNGRVYTLAEAFEETKKEHPNGTLQWRILRKPVKVKRLPIPKNAPAGVLASYEEQDDEVVVTFSEALNERQENNYLINVMNRIEEGFNASEPAAA